MQWYEIGLFIEHFFGPLLIMLDLPLGPELEEFNNSCNQMAMLF